jgi:hypothetical protein
LAEPSAARSAPSTGPRVEREQGVLVVGGSLEPADAVALCARAHPLLADLASADPGPIVCEVGGLRADVAAVDAVARLALVACRLERGVRLRNASPILRELLALVGLASVVPGEPGSGLDSGR